MLAAHEHSNDKNLLTDTGRKCKAKNFGVENKMIDYTNYYWSVSMSIN